MVKSCKTTTVSVVDTCHCDCGLLIETVKHYCHVTGGAAGAVSRITGVLGKGIATLTLDDAYQKQRREELNRRPADLKEGLARGGKGLVMVHMLFAMHFMRN